MATVPTPISDPPRGVAKTLAGYVIQDYTLTTNPIAEQVPDQNGAIADEMVYDHRTDLTLNVIGTANNSTAPVGTNDVFAFDGVNYCVDSIAEAGSYQSVMRWTVTAHKYDNYPA